MKLASYPTVDLSLDSTSFSETSANTVLSYTLLIPVPVIDLTVTLPPLISLLDNE